MCLSIHTGIGKCLGLSTDGRRLNGVNLTPPCDCCMLITGNFSYPSGDGGEASNAGTAHGHNAENQFTLEATVFRILVHGADISVRRMVVGLLVLLPTCITGVYNFGTLTGAFPSRSNCPKSSYRPLTTLPLSGLAKVREGSFCFCQLIIQCYSEQCTAYSKIRLQLHQACLAIGIDPPP